MPTAPASDLQQLLAEDALEHPPRQPLLVREAAAPERRAEPIRDRLEPFGRTVGHAFDSSSVRAARPARRMVCRSRSAPTSVAEQRQSNLLITPLFPFWDSRRLPGGNRYVGFRGNELE